MRVDEKYIAKYPWSSLGLALFLFEQTTNDKLALVINLL